MHCRVICILAAAAALAAPATAFNQLAAHGRLHRAPALRGFRAASRAVPVPSAAPAMSAAKEPACMAATGVCVRACPRPQHSHLCGQRVCDADAA
jgi:hypothetical protein